MIEGLKGYPKYKESGVAWLGKVPAGWRVEPVRRMGRVQCGKALAANAPGELRPYLRVANVLDGRIDASSVHTMPFTDEEFEGFRLREGDVLLNEGQSLELVGRAALYRGSPEGCAFQNSLIRVQAYEHALPQYLELLFRHAQASGIFATIATQTTSIAHLGVGRLADLMLVLPPLDEQRAVVRFLTHFERSLRAYIAMRRRLITLLEDEKRAIIGLAVTHGLNPGVELKDSGVPWLGNIPSHWRVEPVRRMGRVQCGKALAANAPGELRPYLRVANVLDGRIDASSVHTMPFTDEEFEGFRLREGDVLLNEGQSLELVGRAALYRGSPEGCAFQNSLIRVQAYEHALPQYLELLFRHAQASGIFATIATQTTSIARLGVGRLADLMLVLPPRDEQQAILDHVNTATGTTDKIVTSILRELDLLRSYWARIVSDVATGRFDVRDAAWKLLDPALDDESIASDAEDPHSESTF